MSATGNVGAGGTHALLKAASDRLVCTICRIARERFAGEPGLCVPQSPGSPGIAGRPVASLIAHVTDRANHDRRYATNYAKIR